MIDCKIDFEGMAWVEAAPGARFKVFKYEGKQIRLLEFRREFVEPDWCRKGHIGYMLEGELDVEFADVASTVSLRAQRSKLKEGDSAMSFPSGQVGTPDRTSGVVTFKAGEGVFIPGGETHKHKARAVTEVVRLVLVEEV